MRVFTCKFSEKTNYGRVGYQLKDKSGNNYGNRETENIFYHAEGCYQAFVSLPDDFEGVIVWDSGGGPASHFLGEIPPLKPEKADGGKKTPEQFPDMSHIININNPRDVILSTAPTYGNMQIGNNIVAILPLLNRLYFPNLDDAEIKIITQEFQTIYNKLNDQEKAKLRDDVRKIITEKANSDSGFKEKLKQFGKRIATGSLNIGTGVLTGILTECAKGRI